MLASISSRRPPALAEDSITGPRDTAGSGVASGGNEAGGTARGDMAVRELRASGGTAVPGVEEARSLRCRLVLAVASVAPVAATAASSVLVSAARWRGVASGWELVAAASRGDVAAAASPEFSESVVVLRSHSYLRRG